MKRFIKFIFSAVLILSAVSLSAVGYYDANLGNNYCIEKGGRLHLNTSDVLKVSEVLRQTETVSNEKTNLRSYDVQLKLLGIIPVKTVHVTEAESAEVLVLGCPFGIKIYTDGVMIVGFNDVDTHQGSLNPALNAGLKAGDVILEIDGVKMKENTDVQGAVLTSKGKKLTMLIRRDGKTFTVSVTPEMSATENKWKTGMWVRDSSAGIGTLTFYNPSTNIVAGLGHGICDPDTDSLLPLESGEFLEADIIGLKKSTKDEAGELQGIFSGGEVAEFKCNDITGVYGTSCCNDFEGQLMEVALKQEIKVGKATILTTLDDGGPNFYECEIEKIYLGDDSKIKNMIIKVTDKKLLSKTGGIVQGMSGSPIIQNGKLIGAVTHVLVDDPTKGYAIFAENMLETAQGVIK